MNNSQIQQTADYSSQTNISSLSEGKKKGYIAGIISLLISIVLIIIVVNFGWDLTGQMLTAFSVLFGILGIGSLIKPNTVGNLTAQILENIGKNSSKK